MSKSEANTSLSIKQATGCLGVLFSRVPGSSLSEMVHVNKKRVSIYTCVECRLECAQTACEKNLVMNRLDVISQAAPVGSLEFALFASEADSVQVTDL